MLGDEADIAGPQSGHAEKLGRSLIPVRPESGLFSRFGLDIAADDDLISVRAHSPDASSFAPACAGILDGRLATTR